MYALWWASKINFLETVRSESPKLIRMTKPQMEGGDQIIVDNAETEAIPNHSTRVDTG